MLQPETKNRNKLKIYTYPDPVLRKKAEPVEVIDERIRRLAQDMLFTMYEAPGIGLAANQVGELLRVIVFDLEPEKNGNHPCVLINPEIIDAQGEVTTEEACLSVIDYRADVKRKALVRVRGLDLEGNELCFDADGLLAVCLQHEIDHLDGILFIDYLSALKRALYKKRLKKKLKKSS
ncbi:MAG TPA: peptide deformylase [Desulfobacterales bacterium]|nr:peptide deformylase [Desulfobacterales bacterium]